MQGQTQGEVQEHAQGGHMHGQVVPEGGRLSIPFISPE